jgi:uncharacterized RDD family membrane protein YckC
MSKGKLQMRYCDKCGAVIPEDAKFCPVCGNPVSIGAEQVAPSAPAGEPSLTLAVWAERFIAWLIDIVIIGVITGILGLFAWWQALTVLHNFPWWIPFFNFGPNGILLFLYWTFMEGTYGQSFGKMVMRIKVTRLDGRPAGIGPAAVESVGKAFFLPLDLLIGWALHPRKRQRIFNYISETIVTKVT